MDAWTVYWILKLDSVKGFLFVVPSAFCALNFLWAAISSDNWSQPPSENYKTFKSRFKVWTVYVSVCSLILLTLIPSTKEMAAIIVLPRIASSENLETVVKDGGDIYKLAVSRIKDVLGEEK